jgi:hypothetical protein
MQGGTMFGIVMSGMNDSLAFIAAGGGIDILD